MINNPNPIDQDSKTWGMLVHLSALLTGFIGPLVILLVKKGQMPFVEENAKEALNFQISVLIYVIISVILACVFIGIFTMIAVVVCNLIFTVMAAVQANEGKVYRYPLCIKFIR
jgi:uncharacterized protein